MLLSPTDFEMRPDVVHGDLGDGVEVPVDAAGDVVARCRRRRSRESRSSREKRAATSQAPQCAAVDREVVDRHDALEVRRTPAGRSCAALAGEEVARLDVEAAEVRIGIVASGATNACMYSPCSRRAGRRTSAISGSIMSAPSVSIVPGVDQVDREEMRFRLRGERDVRSSWRNLWVYEKPEVDQIVGPSRNRQAGESRGHVVRRVAAEAEAEVVGLAEAAGGEGHALVEEGLVDRDARVAIAADEGVRQARSWNVVKSVRGELLERERLLEVADADVLDDRDVVHADVDVLERRLAVACSAKSYSNL